MSLEEIEQKRAYLNSLRRFTMEELKGIHNDVIEMNTNVNPRSEEVEGINRVYDYIDYIMKEESSFPYPKGYTHPINEDLLQDLNRIILLPYSCYLPCEKGFYRRGQCKIDERILPSYDVFVPRLKELLHYYTTTGSDLVTKHAFFHLEFLTEIHPFCNGNGRTARAFMNLELARAGYPMIGLKRNDIDRYYEAFTEYIKCKDQTMMEQLILESVDRELDRQILIKSKI